ncbi:MAG TPA: DUF3343 domain-containing protein [Chitinivibrionales bacterium]|nr:DUF3343 domain-containing protein [Chitinivibrionales bacterium]
MNNVIAVFDSTRAAINAEKLCAKNGISCQVIPVPRDISAECGIALEINAGDKDSVEKIFNQGNVKVRFYNR